MQYLTLQCLLVVAVWCAEEERVLGGLTALGWKACQHQNCTRLQYCNSEGHCSDCGRVCDNGYNFDQLTCEEKCQDYIHDRVRHYLTKEDSLKATKDLKDTIEWLRGLVAISITISCLAALGCLALGGALWLARPRTTIHKHKKDISPISVIIGNNNTEAGENKSEKSAGGGVGQSVVTATTPLSTRHPSEDATLEFAYDNHGLASSPRPTPRHETTF